MRKRDLDVLTALPEAKFERVIRRLTIAEKQELFDNIASKPPAEPAARLRWLADREWERNFLDWMGTLSICDMSAAYVRLAQSENPAVIKQDFAATRVAAFPSKDNTNGTTTTDTC